MPEPSIFTSLQIAQLPPYAVSKPELFEFLQTFSKGLSKNQVKKRQTIFGLNELKEKHKISAWHILFSQFANVLIVILFFAAIFSLFMGEVFDALAIFIIIFLNSILGFIQEYKAEKSMEDLQKMETLQCRVIRAGKEQTIDAKQLVPGDIIVLYEGEKIPADARILESCSLEVDESILTGESTTSAKQDKIMVKKSALAERKNMLFSGCNITRGHAKALVVLTGMETQIGRIATDIQQAKDQDTPLQKALARLGKMLALISIGVAIPGLIAGILLGRDPTEMMMLAVSLAVSSIPEGLPIVVTIALALGIKKMAKVRVLVRKLAVAEALGGTDIICSDKTGTITHNQMTVKSLFLPKLGFFGVPGDGLSIKGKATLDKKLNKKYSFKFSNTKANIKSAIHNLAVASILCSDAVLDFGDPTEKALVVLGRKLGLNEEDLRKEQPRLAELPFDSAKKYMAVMAREADQKKAIIKGAPELIFSICQLNKKQRALYAQITDEFTTQGLRVLAVAQKTVARRAQMKKLSQYQFVGLLAMHDPPRKNVAKAIKMCRQAGVRVIMITGDHKNTAQAIAKKIGLSTSGTITGNELDSLTEDEFKKVIQKINVFARVAPRHKVQICKGLQQMGFQVAMTGDGVNDAPAIKRADVGIAVGSGTDLTKGVADMILLDDSFAHIVEAIKEGRKIFFNIKKFVRFLLSANFDEILEVLTSVLLGIPLSLLPIHILWINLMTDSLPALALINDVPEDDLMKRKPYRPEKEILSGVVSFALIAGIIDYIFTYGFYLFILFIVKRPLIEARTMSFTASVLFEFFLVFAIRSEKKSAIKIGLFSNKLLCLAVLLGIFAQIFAIYNPWAQEIFKTTALSWQDWAMAIASASSGFWVIEGWKWVKEKFFMLQSSYAKTN